MAESTDVRLARMEEGIVSLHSKLDLYSKNVDRSFKPVQDRVDNHHIALAVLKRDRFWLFTLSSAAFTLGLAVAFGHHL